MTVRTNERIAWFNGQFMPESQVRIPFRDSSWVYGDGAFDLVISLGCLHNLKLFELETAVAEINLVGKNKYIMVEGYRNELEQFNLECWALTAESILHTS